MKTTLKLDVAQGQTLLPAIKAQIATLQAIVDQLEGGRSQRKGKGRGKGKRVVSAETRAKIAAAQKKRWAKAKKSE
jgi:hypothetical protein